MAFFCAYIAFIKIVQFSVPFIASTHPSEFKLNKVNFVKFLNANMSSIPGDLTPI